jgi:hypothetical protein
VSGYSGYSGSGVSGYSGYSGGGITARQSVANPWFGTPTTSRAMGTVYQNLTGNPLYIVVTGSGPAGTNIQAVTDNSSSPTTVVAEGSSAYSSGIGLVPFIVLNNNYYKVVSTCTLVYWAEWEI